MRLVDSLEGEFYTGKGPKNDDGLLPVFFYTSRRLPPVSICGRSTEDDSEDPEALYEVRVIDNDYNTYQEVMQIAMLALGIREEQAFVIAWEVDHLGSCAVAHAPKAEADEIANLIRTIGIEVQVNPINEAPC
jgi:ATP-dependent Clp protease adapter protein ClpS